MTSRASRSGFAFIPAALSLLGSCGDVRPPTAPIPSPSPASCADLGGAWTAQYSTACAVFGSQAVVVTQASCVATFTVSGVGQFSADLTSPTRRVTVDLPADCAGGARTGGVLDPLADGRYSITFGGFAPCCSHGGVALQR